MFGQQDRYRLQRSISASIILSARNIHLERNEASLDDILKSNLGALQEDEARQILQEAQEEALAALERLQNRRITNFVLQSTREAALNRWRKSCL